MRRRKPTQAELYEAYDRYAEEVRELIKKETNRIALAGFDELNVIRTKTITTRLYERVDRLNRRRYRELCEDVALWVYWQYDLEPPKRDWTKVVNERLREYDPVTQYVYERELELKRLMLEEAVLTAREKGDRNALNDALKLAANLLLTQSLQGGLDLMGETEQEAFAEAARELGLDEDEAFVQYHACNDSRTCGECKEDDGKIYPVNGAPSIPRHYRCRCWYTRVIV